MGELEDMMGIDNMGEMDLGNAFAGFPSQLGGGGAPGAFGGAYGGLGGQNSEEEAMLAAAIAASMADMSPEE